MPRTLISSVDPSAALDRDHAVGSATWDPRFRSVIDNSPLGFCRVSPDGRFVAVNRALCALVGSDEPELLASNVRRLDVDPGQWQQLIDDVTRQPNAAPVESSWRSRDGRTLVVRISTHAQRDERGIVAYIDGYVEDVTALRATEQALRQAEKLAALGQLISGVAHELNNPLSAILLFTEDLLATERPDEDRDALGIIAQQARRSRSIVRDLLSFVRNREVTREQVEPAAFFELVRRALGPQVAQLGVSLHVEVVPGVAAIQADGAALEQVMTNLVINAAQAAGRGGRVVVRAHRAGADYLIEVLDDGPGLAAEVLPRLFEPFFTTKPSGQGTGLGLSVSLGLVEQHGGTITAANRGLADGRGACFAVRLPFTDQRAPIERGNEAPAASVNDSGPRHVLIVDDEETIRAALNRFYSRRGWRVTEAADGAVAVERLVDAGESFDLVVSDVKMPRVSGIELHATLRAVRPQMLPRMIFCTGEAESRAVASFVAESGCRVLLKPFDLRTLASVSDEVAVQRPPEGQVLTH